VDPLGLQLGTAGTPILVTTNDLDNIESLNVLNYIETAQATTLVRPPIAPFLPYPSRINLKHVSSHIIS